MKIKLVVEQKENSFLKKEHRWITRSDWIEKYYDHEKYCRYNIIYPKEIKIDNNFNTFCMLTDTFNNKKYNYLNNCLNNKILPMSNERGVPIDASKEFLSIIENNKGKYFGASFIYLSELKDLLNERYFNFELYYEGYLIFIRFSQILFKKELPLKKDPKLYLTSIPKDGKEITIDYAIENYSNLMKLNDRNKYFIKHSWKTKYCELDTWLENLIKYMIRIQQTESICHHCMRICFLFIN